MGRARTVHTPRGGLPHMSVRSAEIVLLVAGVVAAVVVFGDLLGQYLYNDDFEWLAAARFDMTPANLFTFRVVDFFRPFINLSFYIQEHVAPGNLPLYYAENIFLHLANTVLVYLLLARILNDRRVAGCAAFLFLITSVHYAAVAWISARTTLLGSLFLLVALNVAMSRRGRGALALALLCYAMALLSKEEAVAGLFLVGLLYFFRGHGAEERVDRRTAFGFAAVTAAYLAARFLVMGRVQQGYWEPGLHALRNVGGGFLYQVFPWGIVSLVKPGHVIATPAHAFWPEILAVPVIAVLVGIAFLLRRTREMALVLGWALVSLVPASLFTFRFFTTSMNTQDRYYYLSSVGIVAALALVLVALWDVGRRRVLLRALVVVALAWIAAGEYRQVSWRHGRWHTVTGNYRKLMDVAVSKLDGASGLDVCVVQEPNAARPYIMQGLRMERPRWNVMAVRSEEEARTHRPCMYLLLEAEGSKVRMAARPLTE